MEINSKSMIGSLMRHLNLPLRAAEVGVAEGIYAREILNWNVLEMLYLIDIWERVPFIEGCGSADQEWHDKNYNEVIEMTKDYGERVKLLKGFSFTVAKEIPDDSLGWVHVDADHTYMGVKSDIEVFFPKLVKGGIMSFHDYWNPTYGVFRAVQEFTNNEGVHLLPEDGNIVNVGCYIIKGELDGV